jgi:hypothetical protein
MDYPWSNIYADNGIFLHEVFTAYDNSSVDGWNLVATQDWVSKVVVAVLNERIQEVNNLAASALSTARTALSKAKKAISSILDWCGHWNGVGFLTGWGALPVPGGINLIITGSQVIADTDSDGNLTGSIKEMTNDAWVGTMPIPTASITTPDGGTLADYITALEKWVTNVNTWAEAMNSHVHNFSVSASVDNSSHKHDITTGSSETEAKSSGGSISTGTKQTGGPTAQWQ